MSLLTVSEFAKKKGVSHTAVQKAIKNKRLVNSVVQGPKKLMLDPVLAAVEWEKNTDHSKRFVGADIRVQPRAEPAEMQDNIRADQPAAMTGSAPSLHLSRQMHEAYRAKLAKLEFEEKSGKLVPAEKVKDEAFKLARTVRDAMLNIPDRVAAEFAGITTAAEIHMRLTDEIRIALESLTSNVVD